MAAVAMIPSNWIPPRLPRSPTRLLNCPRTGGMDRGGILGQDGGLAQVGGEANDVEVLVDIVHDLGLQEGLGSVVHDLVAELGLGNILSQLLDASAASLGGSVFVDDLVTLPLGGLAVGKLGHQLLDHLKLTTEEGILGHVHAVPVHLEEVKVDTGDGLDESLVGGGKLELSEEAGSHAAGGGSGETDLAVDNDGAVDSGALQSLAKSVEVSLSGGSRVADGDPLVDQAGELLLEPLNGQGEGGQLLDLDLVFRLVDINVLELAIVALGAALHDSHELLLVLLDGVASDVAELGVLSDLVRGTSADGVAVHVHDRLLAHVEPDDLVGLGVGFTAGLVDGSLESSDGGLTAAVDLVSGHPAEVGHTIDLFRQFLDFVEMIGH